MRYPDGGGLTAAGRARREKVRPSTAAMFEQHMDPVQVACQLRVSTKSAYQWRRRCRAGAPRRWPPKARAGRCAACRRRSWPGCAPSWTRARRCTAGLAAIMKNRLKRIQYRPGLIDGFLAQTGLGLKPEPP
jgi:hypothetical protein